MKIRQKESEQPVRPQVERFAPDPQQGLSAEQAALRAQQGYRNTPVDVYKRQSLMLVEALISILPNRS